MHIKTSATPNIKQFLPPKRILLGPGPSDVPQRILDAMARPTIGHLDPEFIRMMDEVKSMLQYAFKTKNELTMAVSAPGSAGMETCFVNLVEPGDKIIVCINGVFGGRMKENVDRIGGKAIVVEDEWGKPVDPNKVEAALKKNPDTKILAFVHAETSTGASSDAETLVKLAHNHNALVIVDAVTSLGGIPLFVDDWNIDAIYSGSQKCLSCTPGLSPISFNQRAVDVIKKRKTKIQSWFMDLNLVMNYWGGGTKRAYHHTAPINALYGLHESLVLLLEEGVENRWNRHKENHIILKDELQKLNLEFFVEEKYRLPQLNSVKIPPGVDDANVRGRLLNEFNIEIGNGLGPMAGKIWRIGLLGYSSIRENINKLTQALKKIL